MLNRSNLAKRSNTHSVKFMSLSLANLPPEMRTKAEFQPCMAFIKCDAGSLKKFNEILVDEYMLKEWRDVTFYDAWAKETFTTDIFLILMVNDLQGVAEAVGIPHIGSKLNACTFVYHT